MIEIEPPIFLQNCNTQLLYRYVRKYSFSKAGSTLRGIKFRQTFQIGSHPFRKFYLLVLESNCLLTDKSKDAIPMEWTTVPARFFNFWAAT